MAVANARNSRIARPRAARACALTRSGFIPERTVCGMPGMLLRGIRSVAGAAGRTESITAICEPVTGCSPTWIGVIDLGLPLKAATIDCDSTRYLPSLTDRSEEHTSELQSLMRTSYAAFCLKKKNKNMNRL